VIARDRKGVLPQRLKPEFYYGLSGPAKARALIRTGPRQERDWIAGIARDRKSR